MDKVVTVMARRWFEKVNGNTYHSVMVYYDGDLVNKETGELTEINYGYGSAWEQTAQELLTRHGIYRDSKLMLRRMVEEENGDKLVWDVIDVPKEKDLYFM